MPINGSVQDNPQGFGEVSLDIREYLEQAYNLIQQMQSFDLGYFERLSWSYTDEQGKERLMDMADILPAADTLEAFLTQCDKCNALAVKLYMYSPTAQANSHSVLSAWQTQHQLTAEIGKAKTQANNLTSDIDMRFADAEKSLSTSSLKGDEHFREALQTSHDNYITLLNANIDNLDQAGRLATRLSSLCINPFVQNLP